MMSGAQGLRTLDTAKLDGVELEHGAWGTATPDVGTWDAVGLEIADKALAFVRSMPIGSKTVANQWQISGKSVAKQWQNSGKLAIIGYPHAPYRKWTIGPSGVSNCLPPVRCVQVFNYSRFAIVLPLICH